MMTRDGNTLCFGAQGGSKPQRDGVVIAMAAEKENSVAMIQKSTSSVSAANPDVDVIVASR